ncbi:MAG: MoxR family ATPase [Clostridiales bacterium]|nr:MoxR family ATPase [Clostridiales bacterium]MDY5975656.1 MoxR family ATPase [Anaerovoracaceae bacterium]
MTDSIYRFKSADNYIISDDLMVTANIAIAMNKPLLVKGEPGTGKTALAEAIARSLDMDLIVWSIKSTTKAQDGLYQYDVVRRLYDSELGNEGVEDISRYIKLGKIGEAFTSDRQCVLLIDEIDKADLEFPNDLLWELDRMEFYIPETDETIRAKNPPVVVITSNAEKELPDAFLRRCAFHFIEFPDQSMMRDIILAHYPDIEESLISQVLDAFFYVREYFDLKKKPSTSELLDWIKALRLSGLPTDSLRQDMPLAGFLLKKDEDLEQFRNTYGGLR